jgi:hypothetical protein
LARVFPRRCGIDAGQADKTSLAAVLNDGVDHLRRAGRRIFVRPGENLRDISASDFVFGRSVTDGMIGHTRWPGLWLPEVDAEGRRRDLPAHIPWIDRSHLHVK